MKSRKHFLLDAARMDGLLYKALDENENHRCLYEGDSKTMLGAAAPWLFKLHYRSDLVDLVLQYGIGNSWGIIIESSIDEEELYRHLRKFLIVQKEDGKELYFRYYDPRVLRDFLPTCDREQLQEFFGPVDAFVLEDEDGNMLQFTLDGADLKRKELNIDLKEFLLTGYETENSIEELTETKDDKPKGKGEHWDF